MADPAYPRLGALRGPAAFVEHATRLGVELPFDFELTPGPDSPLNQSISKAGVALGNRIAVHPMEGWDCTEDGRPTEATFRRWRRFGASGAKLIWGGEAAAVRHDGRANPNQLLADRKHLADLVALREAAVEEHQKAVGSTAGLVIGLQLTHSGRYSAPNVKGRLEPRIAFRHPLLDRRVGVSSDDAVLTDDDLRRLIDDFIAAAKVAAEAGFDFVDIKHCHGYLGHELLGGHTRPGAFGGSIENRTRFLRDIAAGVRAASPNLKIGIRVSAFDLVPFRPDPSKSSPGKPGPGAPEPFETLLPYRYGFGVAANDPTRPDLSETVRFLALLENLGVGLVNLSAGSPYYNPHVIRPAYYPPSDGYLPPEDPLVGVSRQMAAVRDLKRSFPNLLIVGSAYSYLQDFLPNVAQAAVRDGWTDCVGIGRMLLSYPEILLDAANGRPIQTKKICRTFSDCTTAPRNGLPSGCYPLDDYYKASETAAKLKAVKVAVKSKL